MSFCDPSHEKAYWACPVDHEPPGIVQQAKEIGYAFALSRAEVLDIFDERSVGPFAGVEQPDDVVGLVVSKCIDRLETCYAFKQMRQRKSHDDLDVNPGASDDEQAGLGRWSA